MNGKEIAELIAFMEVARSQSFRRAASRLGMSPSAVSHTIRSLETRLGVRVLSRTTRSVSLTQAGERLLQRVEPAISDIRQAVRESAAFQASPQGTVRINLPRIAAQLVLVPRLHAFLERYPRINVDLVIDDTLTDIVSQGFDAGIRSGERLQQDMVARQLTPALNMAVVGAPSYFARRSPPEVPADLHKHICINYRWSDSNALYAWTFQEGDRRFDLQVRYALTLNDTSLIVAAVLEGTGLAYLPQNHLQTHFDSGELVRVLPSWTPSIPGFYLYYPHREHMPSALRAFVDFMTEPPIKDSHS
ncbi:LysR family transcriptional regulator [Salinicola sp. MH3R3-1]|uniref:LysR family transcriptional regulator n=1 Tax=Salinicola sp. MH3R3-1 TaxID=1928762 RepID=UPI00094F2A10|nr:LysR family transcriptional regulator [Salinicola sp. MH3R3-1]OLO07773.1 LysR family transcriptional regulator [Salinicola sp. MH3R3-1]